MIYIHGVFSGFPHLNFLFHGSMDRWTKLRLDNEEIHSDSPRMTQNAGAMPGSMVVCCTLGSQDRSLDRGWGQRYTARWIVQPSMIRSCQGEGDVKLLVLAIWVVIRVVTVVTISN